MDTARLRVVAEVILCTPTELRFALGEPDVDTTSVDNVAFALEDKSYFIQEADKLKAIDLGAGPSLSSETLCGRVIAALKSAALRNESVGAGYIDRNWPPALKESGAWPLASLRQSFLNGSLTRLLDPDTTLRGKIVEFIGRGGMAMIWPSAPA